MTPRTEDGEDPHCTTPLVMDNVPLEIAAMIMENLLEYDLAPALDTA
jgi:hypothetical protein